MSSPPPAATDPPASDWPELPPGLAPPPDDPDALTPEKIDELGFEGMAALIVDAALRDLLRPDAPPELREALRARALERIYEETRRRPHLPYVPEIPEPPIEQTQAEIEAEAERRLRWQEAWDARRAEAQPSPEEIAAARAKVIAELRRVAREALREPTRDADSRR